ncbi:MAG: cellulase family glycosylhydrolase [Actinomycetota bacterium]|nr:cellulase family glycosylhydrolase [Actinomycetota bacterium]
MPEAPRATRRPLLTAVASLLALLLLAIGLGACSRSSSFVTRSGAGLTLDGAPYRFVGFNLYDGAASDVFSCQPQSRLDDTALADTMKAIREQAGATVVRFWAYQTYTAGGTDFSGVDRFIAAAAQEGLRVMPVLEDGPGDCSTGEKGVPLSKADNGQWYGGGYERPLGWASRSYRDYVRVMAKHYRDNPTILGWTMVNEAETGARDATGRSVLVSFAGDVSAVIKAADPNHLVTLGSQSNGAPGASGADFREVYAQAGLDFTEVHDWNRWGSDTEAMPGSAEGALPDPGSTQCAARDAKIACSFAIAKLLGKPIVVGEVGVSASDDAGRTRRAQLVDAKARAAFAAGASGYLVWHLDRTRTDDLSVVTSPPDPLLPILKAVASGSS